VLPVLPVLQILSVLSVITTLPFLTVCQFCLYYSNPFQNGNNYPQIIYQWLIFVVCDYVGLYTHVMSICLFIYVGIYLFIHYSLRSQGMRLLP